MASKSKKKVAAKRTTNLRKAQHSHIRKAKPRSVLEELQELLDVSPNKGIPMCEQQHREASRLTDVDVDQLADLLAKRLVPPVVEPDPEPVINAAAPAPSPVEAAMLDLINVSEETEKLVHELGVRLAPVMRDGTGDVGVLGRVADSHNVPLVDALHQRASQITGINGVLLDLLDRLAT
jgi:hypothetical protein